ncbi:MAG TPA: RNA polymerase sigma factor [Polyangia bacterium]|nr:RNA polymerase sigma factor [Polyangia bacterium]
MSTPAKAHAVAELAADDPCLAGCRAGRPEAIEKLFRTYAGMVEGVIGRLVGPTPDFEDLVQTTFTEALGNLGRFRGEAKISTWLCGIAVHVAHHHLRAGKVRRHVSLELVTDDRATALAALVDPSVADKTIDGRRLASRLHALCDRISPKKRIALLLYVMEDRSVEEIAALMRATQTATRSRMYFARRELRKLIRADAELRDLADGLLGAVPEGES